MSMLREFERFWSNKSDPLHRSTDDNYLDAYAEELRILFKNQNYNSVLDLGCGTGTFYQRLGFDEIETFRGVDFSKKMIDKFAADFPNATLICQDASAYKDDNKYDLIFSNSVVQNFDKNMFVQHIENATLMLKEGGLIVVASIPWAILKLAYLAEEAGPNPGKANYLKGILGYLNRSARGNGRWYSCREIALIADRYGLETEFFGSLNYPYRMHAVLRRRK